MAERKLPIRKRRASKGRLIRVSDLVYKTLDKCRYGRSWDTFLRRLLGLPTRSGKAQPLVEGVLEAVTGTFHLKAPGKSWSVLELHAYEQAFRATARQNPKARTVPKPLRMRELP